jgi:hypothetical protein
LFVKLFKIDEYGVLKDAEKNILIPSNMKMNNLTVHTENHDIKITQNLEIIDAITLSTAFWGASIFASNI